MYNALGPKTTTRSPGRLCKSESLRRQIAWPANKNHFSQPFCLNVQGRDGNKTLGKPAKTQEKQSNSCFRQRRATYSFSTKTESYIISFRKTVNRKLSPFQNTVKRTSVLLSCDLVCALASFSFTILHF